MRRNVELEINSANLIKSAAISAMHSTIVGRALRLPTKTLINTWLTARVSRATRRRSRSNGWVRSGEDKPLKRLKVLHPSHARPKPCDSKEIFAARECLSLAHLRKGGNNNEKFAKILLTAR